MKKVSDALLGNLKEQWEKACNAYLLELLNMWELSASYGYWISDEVGTVYSYGETLFIDMDDMRYCVENAITYEEYLGWQDYNIDAHNFGFNNINLSSWHKGCPRLSKEQIQHLYDLKKELNEEVERMKEEIKNGNSKSY